MPEIKAALCRAFGAPMTIEPVILRPPEGGEVEVALDAVAICHSDISFVEGAWGGSLPVIAGHEAAGRILTVGPEVKGHLPGDRVVVTLIRACGTCQSCASGRPVACEMRGDEPPSPITLPDGTPVRQGMSTAAFAERVVVDQSQIGPVPDTVAMEAAALLACGVITGVGAVVNTARVRPGQDVVVVGAGGVGLNAIQGARIAGARRIVAVDLNEGRLAHARTFGATDGLLVGHADPGAALEALIGRRADAVIVTVGAIPAYNAAPDFLAPGGQVILVGMPHGGAEAKYVPVNLADAGQGMRGSRMGDAVIARDIPWLVDLYMQDRLMLDELISRRWAFEDINAAMADTKAGGARRNVIVFDT
ncbi:MAG: zinc-binding dehydrogenase [Pseudomonadota bacterium]